MDRQVLEKSFGVLIKKMKEEYVETPSLSRFRKGGRGI